ncbi:AAA family ATPase [Tsuneonella amylolytica]|uniref:AAA family ATPase n=1 Tax=Tsuneonella amylolytica TaxID=2338327 RepID=UPI000EA9D8A1|nr:P-loop NTPase [Tsuneonella amylolytica]
MSNYNVPFNLRDGLSPQSSDAAMIVASEHHLSTIRGGVLDGCDGAAFVPLDPTAPLPANRLRDAGVLVLEVDQTDDASLQRLASARIDYPDLSIIVALRDASVSLVRTLIRQGVADVAELPFVPSVLSTQILDALSRRTVDVRPRELAPMVSIIGATGGSGATTVLSHLGGALANRFHGSRGVCLLDLDLQGGDIASYLGVTSKASVDSLLEAGSRMDLELVRSTVTDARAGLGFISAPEAIKPMDTVDPGQVIELLRLTRSLYDFVLVDLPPVWSSWTIAIARASDRLVMVSDTAISSVRQANRRLRLFNEVDIPRSRIDVVLNRMERKLFGSISSDHIANALGGKVVATLAAEPGLLGEAQDQGKLVGDLSAKARFARDVDKLAEHLVEAVGAH